MLNKNIMKTLISRLTRNISSS